MGAAEDQRCYEHVAGAARQPVALEERQLSGPHRDVGEEVDIVRQDRRHRDVRVPDERDSDAVDLRPPEEVARIRFALDEGARFPAREPVRAKADVLPAPIGAASERVHSLLERPLEQMRRLGWEVGVQHSRVGERPGPAYEQSALVLSKHLLHLPLRRRGRQAEGGMRVDAPGEREVIRRERRAVVPEDARLQPIDCLHAAVGEHAPRLGVQLRKRLDERRPRRARVVDQRQVCVEERANRREGGLALRGRP